MLTPFFIVSCRTLCFYFNKCLCVSQNELALSLPAVGYARELHGKQEYRWFPVRLEVRSRHLVTVAICSRVCSCYRHCYSGGTGSVFYRRWASCFLEEPFFSCLCPDRFIVWLWKSVLRTRSGKDYDNLQRYMHDNKLTVTKKQEGKGKQEQIQIRSERLG